MISQSTNHAIQHLLGFYDTPKSLQPIYLSSYFIWLNRMNQTNQICYG